MAIGNPKINVEWYGIDLQVELIQWGDEDKEEEYIITFPYVEADCTKLQNFMNKDIVSFVDSNQYELYEEIFADNKNLILANDAWNEHHCEDDKGWWLYSAGIILI